MSFKRDGDDEKLLQNLNEQRVRELLGSHVPQDEAKLLSNGKLACMICLHRPVFDTINMLSIHRRGKRHLYELSKHIQCKEDAVVKALKRRIPAKKDDLRADTTLSMMLGSKYVEAKQNTKKHRRKPILEIKAKLPSPKKIETKSVHASVRHYLKSMSKQSSLDKVIEKNRENYGIDLQQKVICGNNSTSVVTSLNSTELNPQETSPQFNQTLDYEMKLRMSGWIKDLTGKWIKDPNAEFDSDEDDIPPPQT